MRICGISDLHGNLEFTIEPCNVLCICGDIFPLKIQSHSKPCEKWFKNEFLPWCNDQPVDEILLIAGNHDIFIERHSDKIKAMIRDFHELRPKVTYLQDEPYEYIDIDSGNVYVFYGTPWCHKFGDWAFMLESDETVFQHFKKMPDSIDILLTHDAPYGISDVCTQDVWWNKREHIGSLPLAEIVKERQPSILLHGHLHTSNHEEEKLGKTSVYNVSLLDERYLMSFKPLYLDFNKN